MQELQAGHAIAGYEILNHVSSGGMASLYLARRRGAAGFSKLVAIKVVHPHLAREPKFIRMFLDEARLAARIQHPAVVSVEELLEEQGSYLMVMEYIHGCSLFDLIKKLAKQRRRLAVDISTWIVAQIADGLHAAHELRDDKGELLNVVHRDVSPQNILLSFKGHPKLIDFGIAKSRAQTEATRVGVLRGKIGYMPPEQANGLALDPTTDVYALGIVLWECLTSRRLFRASSDILQLDMVRDPHVLPPSTHAPVSAALDAVVMHALAPDPKKRIQTAKEFRTRLLAACPEVSALHSSDLAGLLETLMAAELEQSFPWEQLSVERVVASDRFVEQHTQHAPEAGFASDESASESINSTPINFTLEETQAPSSKPPPEPIRFQFDKAAPISPFTAPPVEAHELPVMREPPKPPPPPPKKLTLIRWFTTLLWLTAIAVALGLAGWLAWEEGIIPHTLHPDDPSGGLHLDEVD